MGRITVVLGVVAAAATVTSVMLVQRINSDRQAIESQQARIAELEGRLKAVPAMPAVVTEAPARSADAVPISSGETADETVDEAAAIRRRMQDVNVFMKKQAEALKNPEYRAAMVAQQKVFTRRQMMNLPGWLAIPDEMLDNLAGLMAEQNVRSGENRAMMDPAANPETFRQAIEQTNRDNDAEVAQLLGQERYERWKEFQETGGAREQIVEMNARLGPADSLSENGVRKLARAIAELDRTAHEEFMAQSKALVPENSTDSPSPAVELALAERWLESSRLANEQVRGRARAQLTPKQMKRLDEMLQRKLEIVETSLAMARAKVRQ